MNSISLVSTLAMAVGLAAALPQILQMLSTRSSGGQSVLGWGMGLVTNLSMAYVNLVGFHATALMGSNVLSASLCVIAMLLIVRFGGQVAVDASTIEAHAVGSAPATHVLTRPALVPALTPEQHGSLVAMPTTEFAALREVVMQVEEARERRLFERSADTREPALAAA